MPDRIRFDLDRRPLAVGRIPLPHSHPAGDYHRISLLHRASDVVGKATPAGDGHEVVVSVAPPLAALPPPDGRHQPEADHARAPGLAFLGVSDDDSRHRDHGLIHSDLPVSVRTGFAASTVPHREAPRRNDYRRWGKRGRNLDPVEGRTPRCRRTTYL